MTERQLTEKTYDLLSFTLIGPESRWSTNEIQDGDKPPVSMAAIWNHPWGKYLFLAIKKYHITSRYFRGRVMHLARQWATEPPEDMSAVERGVAYATSANFLMLHSRSSDFTAALFDCLKDGVPEYEINWIEAGECK